MATNDALNLMSNPSCSIYVGSQINNITGNGTNYQIAFDTSLINNQSIANLSTGLITFPKDGIYLIGGSISVLGLGALHTSIQLNAVTTLKTYPLMLLGNPLSLSLSGAMIINYFQMVKANSGNTLSINFAVAGTGLTVDIGVDSSLQVWKVY